MSESSTTSDAVLPDDGPLTAAAVREELLRGYPTKTKKKREKQIVVNDKRRTEDGSWELPVIAANSRTVPGIITQRGCCYAGCKGVILGPTRDIVNITHGPIGCSFYSWLTRRNQMHTPTNEHDNFITYCFSTDMTEENIIFGGPYAGFRGAINFYEEIDRMVNARIWSRVQPPWEAKQPSSETHESITDSNEELQESTTP